MAAYSSATIFHWHIHSGNHIIEWALYRYHASPTCIIETINTVTSRYFPSFVRFSLSTFTSCYNFYLSISLSLSLSILLILLICYSLVSVCVYVFTQLFRVMYCVNLPKSLASVC